VQNYDSYPFSGDVMLEETRRKSLVWIPLPIEHLVPDDL